MTRGAPSIVGNDRPVAPRQLARGMYGFRGSETTGGTGVSRGAADGPDTVPTRREKKCGFEVRWPPGGHMRTPIYLQNSRFT